MIPRLSDFLLEYYELKDKNSERFSRSKSISMNTWFELFKKNCELSEHTYLYRSIKRIEPYLYVEPSKYEIGETYDVNYMLWLIDDSKEWKEYPKRSQSISCSTDIDYAKNYTGEVYIVIPFKNASVGVCNAIDFWHSHYEIEIWHHFNNFLENLIEDYFKLNVKTKEDFKKALIFIHNNEEKIKNLVDNNTFNYSSKLYGWVDSKEKIEDYLMRMLDPKKTNSVKLEKYNKNFKAPKNKEVYTSSHCLMIRENTFKEIKHML